MIDRCYDFAEAARSRGQRIVGILCEFTPRELIFAAGAVPVCLCGGSAKTATEAERVLPSNICPLIKSTFGYHLTRSNPFLEWADLVIGETTCDGKKKMFEQMSESRPMYILELPQKSDNPDSLAHWTDEVRKLKSHLEQCFDCTISDVKLRSAISLMNRERRLRRQLAELMASDEPPLTGRQLLDFKSIISGIEADLIQYERAYQCLAAGGAAPGSPRSRRAAPCPVRVLLTGVPMVHGAERVLEVIESCGAVVVCMENCTGLKPLLEDVVLDEGDPLEAIARKYYHLPCSVMTPNASRAESLGALVKKYRPDCVMELVWQACLTYDLESCSIRKLVEERFHMPYLKITTDYSLSDSHRIQARVEAVVEMIHARQNDERRFAEQHT